MAARGTDLQSLYFYLLISRDVLPFPLLVIEISCNNRVIGSVHAEFMFADGRTRYTEQG